MIRPLSRSLSTRRRPAPIPGLLAATLALSGCTGGPAADGNTEPVDLAQFSETSDRFTVISTIGEPTGSVEHENRRCDIYRLYTSGLGAGGKAAVKAAEVVTSIATLGLAQIIWAPVRAGTRPKQHTVLMCYAANDGLVEIFDKNPNDGSPPEIRIVNEKLYSAPVGATATRAVTRAELPSTVSATGATPMAAPAAGTIGLDNVSREATDGLERVDPGRVVVPDHASADDLNALSAARTQRADAPASAAKQENSPSRPAAGPDPGIPP